MSAITGIGKGDLGESPFVSRCGAISGDGYVRRSATVRSDEYSVRCRGGYAGVLITHSTLG